MVADDDMVSAFNVEVATSNEEMRRKIAKSKPVDASTLVRIENATPGNADQQVKMFNKNNQTYAYQWYVAFLFYFQCLHRRNV